MGKILAFLPNLPGLRQITFWVDYDRRLWRNNLPRLEIRQPRRCVFFTRVPEHIDIKVSIPRDPFEGQDGGSSDNFSSWVEGEGGLVDGATMGMLRGKVKGAS